MQILIEYEASWRNSFLDGSNDKPLPRGGRNFIGSTAELKKPENQLNREVTHNTIMGILNRLIGDQRKLYQARASEDYYFSDIESSVSFVDRPKYISQEVIYLTNIENSEDKKGYTGMISSDTPIFNSVFSYEFWNVLSLDLEQLCEFIIHSKSVNDFDIARPVALNPIAILSRLEDLSLEKSQECTGLIKQASDILSGLFSAYKPFDSKELQKILPMYCSALYLQMERIERKYDMKMPRASRGGISGISNNGFTPKDFMNVYVTGGKKQVYGSPYVYKDKSDKLNKALIKVSGKIEITLDIDLERAIELQELINNAGVSSFYLGKKGLAYVSEIRLR